MRTDTQKTSVNITEQLSTATQFSPSWPSSKPCPTSRSTTRTLLERFVFRRALSNNVTCHGAIKGEKTVFCHIPCVNILQFPEFLWLLIVND